MRRFFLAAVFILSFILGATMETSLSQEQVQEVSKKRVKSVDVRNNKTVSSATILSKIKTRIGEEFSKGTLDEDIKRLYLLGFFSDVQAEVKEFADGVSVNFIVIERPVLEAVEFKGNKIIRSDRLKPVVKSKVNEFVDEKTLKEDTKLINEFYEKHGYPWAKVDYKLETDPQTNRSKAVLLIEEGVRAKIRRIKVFGNSAFSDKRISKIVKTKTAGFFRSGIYKKETVDEDMERLVNFYRRSGFLDTKSSSELAFDEKKRHIELIIKIEEGHKYITGEITLQGVSVFPEESIRKVLKLKNGDTFTEDALHYDLTSIQEFYFDRGYITAQVRPDTVLNPQTQRIDIKYTIVENQLAYVNKINIRGNTKTKDVVIRRELRIRPGERFDGSKIKRSKERLYNLGFFEELTFDTEPTQVPSKRDLVIEVKEAKTGELSFGGGFSSIDRLIGFVEVEQRNFDLFNFPTFTGDGQDLKLRAQFGTVRRDYLLSWTEPWIFDYPLSFGFDLYNTTRLRSGTSGYAYDEERQGGDLRLGKEFNEYLRGDLTYRLETVDISDISASASSDLRAEEGENTISSLMFQLTRDIRDNRFNPTTGLLLVGSTEIAGGPLSGDKDFTKWIGAVSHYSQYFERFVLELRLRTGIVENYGDSDSVPIYERFFAGGTYTIRGFKERDVGPKDVSGDPVGGRSMLVGNIELTFPIIENLKGAVFFDAGNVWSRVGDFASTGLKYGVGTGIRIKTPIGPVRLDFGYPFNTDPGQEKKGRFHFSMSRGF